MSDPMSIVVGLPGGRISAICEADIVKARGVKYASATRFQRPIPFEKWDGVLDCTAPAPIHPQMVPSRLDLAIGPITRDRNQDEDCLHVSVVTPKRAVQQASKLPVMVFFHGGAYVSGGGDLDAYDASGLAERDVVVVNVTYRLGLLGYQFIPGVAPANLGLFDQIAALEWIQRNIVALGGDPDNVTLFGQSAGADTIFCLMIAEGTENLFHKAILQSAPFGVRLLDREPMLQALGEIADQRLTLNSKARTTDEILSLQLELILAAKPYAGRLMAFGPALGHAPLPNLNQVSERLRLGAPRIPIIVGYTGHEAAPFIPMLEAARPFFSLPLVGRLIKWLAVWYISGSVFQWPADRFHKQYIKFGGTSSLFRFFWHPSRSTLGSTHCLELPFLLGCWPAWKDAPMLGGTASRDVMGSLGSRLKDLWVAFARGEKNKIGSFDVVGNEHGGDITFHK